MEKEARAEVDFNVAHWRCAKNLIIKFATGAGVLVDASCARSTPITALREVN
jgi:hypothetical protein